ncbi:MAG TPA: hypothetical protein VK742_20535 [Candidatus Sulfotelmatobacter sp.]|jgi:hypothetical protein|nr:hypothetical protein [Candidatus Sulfotelmatobacter sp.]
MKNYLTASSLLSIIVVCLFGFYVKTACAVEPASQEQTNQVWGPVNQGVALSISATNKLTNGCYGLTINIKNLGTNNLTIGFMYCRSNYDVFVNFTAKDIQTNSKPADTVYNHEDIGGSLITKILKPGEGMTDWQIYPLSELFDFKAKGIYRVRIQKEFRRIGGDWFKVVSNEIEIKVE